MTPQLNQLESIRHGAADLFLAASRRFHGEPLRISHSPGCPPARASRFAV